MASSVGAGPVVPDAEDDTSDRRESPREPTGDGLLERVFDAALDAFICGLALWTLCFHLSVFLRLRADIATGLWLVTCATAAIAWKRLRPIAPPTPSASQVRVNPATSTVLAAGSCLVAAIAGWAQPTGRRWDLLWVSVIGLAVLGTIVVLTSPRTTAPTGPSRGGTLVLVVALALTILTTGGRFWSSDDVVILNRSLAVENDGGAAFPLRDTLYSDEVFAYSRPDDPPTSIEPLIGTMARALPVSAPTVAYLVVGPVATALLVLALYRLLRGLRASAPAFATAVACAFIFFGASRGAAAFQAGLGSLHQGKFILNLVVLPLAWRHALVWGRDGDRRALALLVATGIAGVGLSSTSLFLLPVVITVGVLAGVIGAGNRWPRLVPASLALAYPLASGVFALSAGPQAPLAATGSGAAHLLVARPLAAIAAPPLSEPAGAWWYSVGWGTTAVISTAAVLTAWLAVRDRAGRLTLLFAPLALFGGLLVPPVYDLMARSWNAREVLWREVWILPIAAGVGLVSSAPTMLRRGALRTAMTIAAPAALAVVLIISGTPQTRRFQYWSLRPPPWDVRTRGLEPSRILIGLVNGSGVVAGPQAVEETIAASHFGVRTVNPRPRELADYRKVDGFHYRERVVVSDALRGVRAPLNFDFAVFAGALETLEVDALCLDRTRPPEWAVHMQRAGYENVNRDRWCTYWKRVRPVTSLA